MDNNIYLAIYQNEKQLVFFSPENTQCICLISKDSLQENLNIASGNVLKDSKNKTATGILIRYRLWIMWTFTFEG